MLYRKIKIKNSKDQNNKNTNTQDIISKLLELKNITTKEEIEKFLNPSKKDFISPYAFCDMKKAVERIKVAVENKEKILIWGDFDCDGVTSTTILSKTLNYLKAQVIEFIPDRLLHGHGLNSKELIKLISKEKVKLIITVDCGISNNSEINLLRGLKVDTIITDHHTTDIELPNAYAIINPQVKDALIDDLSIDNITSLTYNCGAIISYKLSIALLEFFNKENNKNDNDKNVSSKLKDLEEELLTIAACGAIADVVPLLGENRAIVSEGLRILNEKQQNSNRGIYRLLSKNLKDRTITSTDIAFILAPRINAVGRLANAKLSFDFLNSQSDSEVDIIIEKLDNYNSIRQSLCTEVYNDIIAYFDSNKQEEKKDAIILINQSWHIGVIGIVAAHIVEQYQKPCFLMTIDDNNNARCSIRSNDSINVYQVLKENQDLFLGFGGHAQAGGCSFDLDKISFDEVKTSLLKTIKELSNNKKQENILEADVEVSPCDLTFELLGEISKLEPFGQNNEAPVCAMFDVKLEDSKQIGKDSNHLKMIFEKEGLRFDAVKWKENNFLIPNNSTCDIAFYPRLNKFNDKETIQLEIIDVYCPNLNLAKDDSLFKIYDHRLKKAILDTVNDYLKKEALDVAIWAKTIATKEKLSQYENIKKNILDNDNNQKEEDIISHKSLMFFDYPCSNEELREIINSINPQKIHFMNCEIDENIENYIKQINGMIKYCHNRMQGNIDLRRFSLALGVSENFIQIVLEILENLESIEILDVDKIKYAKPFNYEEFQQNSLFEILKEEFHSIINYKKNFLTQDINEIKELIKQE